MIHRALFGSVERFFAILLEHYAGAMPTWLSPVQVAVLAGRDAHTRSTPSGSPRAAARPASVSECDSQPTTTWGAGSGSSRLEKVPYVLVVGDEDVEAGTVGVNRRSVTAARTWRRPRSFIEDVAEGGRRSADHPDEPRASVGRVAKRVRGRRRRRANAPIAAFGRRMRLLPDHRKRGEPSPDNGIVWRDDLSCAILNAYPYTTGHLLVMPIRHVSGLEELTPAESSSLWETARTAVDVLRRGLRPGRGEHRGESRQGRRCGYPGSSPPARAAAMVRGHELHDHRGRGEGHARVAGGDLDQVARCLGQVTDPSFAIVRSPCPGSLPPEVDEDPPEVLGVLLHPVVQRPSPRAGPGTEGRASSAGPMPLPGMISTRLALVRAASSITSLRARSMS